MIRVALVDDEPLAREGLRLRLEREPDVEIIGEAGDAGAAVRLVIEHRPDVLFLDVRMPGRDGFDILREIAERHLPLVVFVTAYGEHGVRAFDVHALDYVLKPVTDARVHEVMRRVRAELARGTGLRYPTRISELLDARDAGRDPAEAPGDGAAATEPVERLSRIAVRDGDRYVLLRVHEIDWIESASNYVRLHARGGAYLLRMTMNEMERRLDPKAFARIHRTAIVNLNRVRAINPGWHGDFDVVLENDKVLRMSRKYRPELLG